MQHHQDKQNFNNNSHSKIVLLHPPLWASLPKVNSIPESGIYPPLA